MVQPPSYMLQRKLSCAPTVDNVSAIGACESAASDCGFAVASRTRRSLVLMPSVRPALLARLASPSCCISGSGPAFSAGHGLIAELVPDEFGESLSICVETPSQKFGEAFISALSLRLKGMRQDNGEGNQAQPPAGAEGDAMMSRQKAQAYYIVAKVLSDASIEPGAEMAEFVQSFAAARSREIGDTWGEGGATPNPLLVCASAVDCLCALVRQHFQELDVSVSPPPRLEPWLRSSVERCVFARVGGIVWRSYVTRLVDDDARYAERAAALAALSDAQLLDDLEVSPVFRGCGVASMSQATRYGKGYCDEIDSLQTPSTAADTDETVSLAISSTRSCDVVPLLPPRPYERAAAALSQLENALASGCGRTPGELVKALSLAQFEMRTGALEASFGQVELSSMDDVMPLFIFVLLRSTLRRPLACARLLEDSLSRDQKLQEEGRAVLLLESAARYVAFDWDIKALTTKSECSLMRI